MSLLDVNLKQEYRSPRDNIVNDFYIPLLKEANLYKRSVGFFSSSSLLEISYGITHLINNNGKIQLIASPHLSEVFAGQYSLISFMGSESGTQFEYSSVAFLPLFI